jgi:nucleoside-diphosphate-sugar epimerase
MISPRDLKPVRGQRILLTGGAGFIATALAERLEADNELVLFDVRFTDTPLSYTALPQRKNVQCVQGDIRDDALVRRLVASADSVVHMAAIVGVRNVLQHSRETLDVNYRGTANLLAGTVGHRGLNRFVYFSTSEVFGANSFRVHEGVYSSIGSYTDARWSYSIAKLAGEHLLHAYHRDLGVPSVIIRPFNVFGPRRTGENALKMFIERALLNEPITIHGDGSQIRSWCYIDDFADGVIRTLSEPAAVGEDFNLGNPTNTLTIYELAKLVVRLLNSRSRIDFVDIDFSDIDIRVPNSDKARRLLGFQPRMEMEEAVVRTAEWYAAQMGVGARVRAPQRLDGKWKVDAAATPAPAAFNGSSAVAS